MRPRVSVCVPAYQSAAHLKETLDSVWGQDFASLKLIVVDDGSNDATAEILAAQTDSRLRVHRREVNLGQVATVAEAVSHANGEKMVKFLDADDLLRADCLGTMVEALDANPEAVFVFSRRTLLVEQPDDPAIRDWLASMSELHVCFERIEEVNDGRELLRQYLRGLLRGNWIAEPAGVMVRRDDLLAVGGYNRRVARTTTWTSGFA